MFVPVSPKPPSPETEYLSEELARTARDFRSGHPGIGDQEVLEAFNLARSKLAAEGGGEAARLKVMIAVGLALAALAGGLALFLVEGGGEAKLPTLLVPALIMVVGLVAVALKSVKASGDARRVAVAVALALLLLGALVGFLVLRGGAGTPLG